MTCLLLGFLSWFSAFFRSRHELAAGAHRVAAAGRRSQAQKPQTEVGPWDRLFWLGLRRSWSRWASVLVVVKPETVVGWHRAGFHWYWRLLSRHRPGRPRITPELRNLIRSMAAENPAWGAPRIHGELLEIGIGNL